MKPKKDKAEFTSRPWTIHNNIGKKGELGIVADNAPCIIAVMCNREAWPTEAHANARLISQAPAMLQTLEIASMKLRSAAGVFGTLALNNNLNDAQRYMADQANKEAWAMHAEIYAIIALAKGEETT